MKTWDNVAKEFGFDLESFVEYDAAHALHHVGDTAADRASIRIIGHLADMAHHNKPVPSKIVSIMNLYNKLPSDTFVRTEEDEEDYAAHVILFLNEKNSGVAIELDNYYADFTERDADAAYLQATSWREKFLSLLA